jgi:hypothetical protein
MKSIFLILLVANALLWSAWKGWLGAEVHDLVNPMHAEPRRLQQQRQPQRVSVGNAAVRSKTLASTDSSAVTACLEIGAFNVTDAKTSLQALAVDFPRVTERTAAAPSGYLVYLPAQASRAQSEMVARRLKDQGEKDVAVILEGSPLRYAISLGLFRTQDAATARTAALATAGITGARILQRSERSPRHYVQVFEVSAQQHNKLDALAQQTGLEWRACNANGSGTSAPTPTNR